jgi:diaminopimelate epimerase
MTTGGVPFVKGHGTLNDFILLPDRDGSLYLSEAQVRALCDRHAGLGADGVIRIAPAAAGGFFMDYRNADGSAAEMCGNGARVFARYLVDAGWQPSGTFSFSTRSGSRTAHLGADGDVSIGMGPVVVDSESKAVLSAGTFTGVRVDVGNPHLVCFLEQDSDLQALDLTRAPEFDRSVFPEGVNIEFVVTLAADRVRMRVYERGVGETRSCGTGTVAVAAAVRAAGGGTAPSVTVEVPGGVVRVDLSDDGATLTGPAVVVASGTINPAFWERNG